MLAQLSSLGFSKYLILKYQQKQWDDPSIRNNPYAEQVLFITLTPVRSLSDFNENTQEIWRSGP